MLNSLIEMASIYWINTSEWLEMTAMSISRAVSEHVWMLFYIALLFTGLIVLRAILFRRAPVNANLARTTRRPRYFGYGTALVLIITFSVWSVFAPLASASIALGVVSPEGSRKTISHLEGGIVRSIHVHEGETVGVGASLVTLEDVRAQAEFSELKERLMFLLAKHARLDAQRKNKAKIEFPDELSRIGGDDAQVIMHAQLELLASQHAADDGRRQIYRQRILQIEAHTTGVKDVIAAQNEQIVLFTTEIENFQTLLDKGLTQASRLSSLQRERAELLADRAVNRAKIAENLQAIGEVEIELLNLREERVESTNNEMAEVENQIAEIRTKLNSRGDVLARTVIKAPISGTVIQLQTTTVGGVVRSGEPIMELVPADAPLIIDARVKPTDIDRVRPGMSARIILSAYKQRNLPLVHGTLLSVSADRLEEDRTGEPYYLAKVTVNAEDIANLTEVKLIPGMPTEVMILNDERSVLRYLLDPIIASFERSFREE